MTLSTHAVAAASIAAALFSVSGCAGLALLEAPEVPSSLQPPARQVLFLEALATGVQIYECTPKPGTAGAWEWSFRAPEAALADRSGRPLGKHYAGPTWEATDGSSVVGEIRARDPGPDPKAIPWLLASARSASSTGSLRGTLSVQRVQTVGGVAPSRPCGPEAARQVERVPYTATYYFYRGAD